MQDRDYASQPPKTRILVAAIAAVVVLGIGVLGVLLAASGGELPSLIEDGLDLIVMALPEDFGVQEAIAWFLIIEGALWLLAAAVYTAIKLPGIEAGPEAEVLRQRLRANLSAAENAAAHAELANMKANAIKRAITLAAGGLVSWFFAWVLLAGFFEF